jgi:CubicO group peptidase (beta-lactamase class C family)
MSRAVDDLSRLTADWPGDKFSLVAADGSGLLGVSGDPDWIAPIASVSKLFTCVAALVAVEEGTIGLDDHAGPADSTVRHLMAHASGLGFDDRTQLFGAGHRRVYSNAGIEILADHLASAAGMPFVAYLREGVVEPLHLKGFQITGSPAHGMHASARHLVTLGQELLLPTLLSPATLAEATSPVFPELRGVLPGFGAAAPNLWGLGFEIRGDKDPHWTGRNHSPRTFGHFGGSGSFLWIDPTTGLIGASVSSEPFGDWALTAWPDANSTLLGRYT